MDAQGRACRTRSRHLRRRSLSRFARSSGSARPAPLAALAVPLVVVVVVLEAAAVAVVGAAEEQAGPRRRGLGRGRERMPEGRSGRARRRRDGSTLAALQVVVVVATR